MSEDNLIAIYKKDELEDLVKNIKFLEKSAYNALRTYLSIIDNESNFEHVDRITEYDDEGIHFHGEYSHCSNCGTDYFDYCLPWDFLYDLEAPIRLAKSIAEEKERRLKLEEERRVQDKLTNEARRKKEYLKLKAEFESDLEDLSPVFPKVDLDG